MTVDQIVEEEGALKRNDRLSDEAEKVLALEMFLTEIEKVKRNLFENGYHKETCHENNHRDDAVFSSFLLPRFSRGL